MEHTFISYNENMLFYVLDRIVTTNNDLPMKLYTIQEGSSNHKPMFIEIRDPVDM